MEAMKFGMKPNYVGWLVDCDTQINSAFTTTSRGAALSVPRERLGRLDSWGDSVASSQAYGRQLQPFFYLRYLIFVLPIVPLNANGVCSRLLIVVQRHG